MRVGVFFSEHSVLVPGHLITPKVRNSYWKEKVQRRFTRIRLIHKNHYERLRRLNLWTSEERV